MTSASNLGVLTRKSGGARTAGKPIIRVFPGLVRMVGAVDRHLVHLCLQQNCRATSSTPEAAADKAHTRRWPAGGDVATGKTDTQTSPQHLNRGVTGRPRNACANLSKTLTNTCLLSLAHRFAYQPD